MYFIEMLCNAVNYTCKREETKSKKKERNKSENFLTEYEA